jgi:uridine kinase
LWSLPFLIHFVCRDNKTHALPYFVYAVGYLAFFWLGSQSDLLDAWRLVSPQIAALSTPYQFLSVLDSSGAAIIHNVIFTIMQVSLAGIVINMYLFGVRSNAVYRMRTTPILIGLTGDSGSGKDTFTRLAREVLGKDRVMAIAGDDYHRWPRGHEMWKVYTHLDVRANDVYEQHKHAIALSNGKSVYKGTYDHNTGEFTEKHIVDPGQIIILQGLHTLSVGALRNLYDLRIFLDPDEDLRHFWKVRRDCKERGYTPQQVIETIQSREKDRDKFVLPQREQADLIVHLTPKEPVDLQRFDSEPELILGIRASNSFNFTQLMARLDDVDTLSATHEPFVDAHWQSLLICGRVTAETLQAIANDIVPNLGDITPAPSFVADLQGCLQLIFLVCLSDKLSWNGQSVNNRI